MDVPSPGMIDHLGPSPYQSPDDRVNGRLDALTPKRTVPGHVEQIVGKTSCKQSCLIGREAMTARFVPSEGVLPLLYPVFNLRPTVVCGNYFV